MAETFEFDGGAGQAVTMRCGVRHGWWKASYPLAQLGVSDEMLIVRSRLKKLNFTIRREDVLDFAPRPLAGLQVDFRRDGQNDSLILYDLTGRIADVLRAHGFAFSGDPARLRPARQAYGFLRVAFVLAGLMVVSLIGLAVLRAILFSGD
jgi:hypothetical protein